MTRPVVLSPFVTCHQRYRLSPTLLLPHEHTELSPFVTIVTFVTCLTDVRFQCQISAIFGAKVEPSGHITRWYFLILLDTENPCARWVCWRFVRVNTELSGIHFSFLQAGGRRFETCTAHQSTKQMSCDSVGSLAQKRAGSVPQVQRNQQNDGTSVARTLHSSACFRSLKNPNRYCATRRIWISSDPSVMR